MKIDRHVTLMLIFFENDVDIRCSLEFKTSYEKYDPKNPPLKTFFCETLYIMKTLIKHRR